MTILVLYGVLMAVVSGAAFVAGILIQKRQPRPYRRLLDALRPARPPVDPALKTFGKWSIALYEGPTPFELSPAADVSNPVITPEDVSDTDAILVADPFIFRTGGKWFMFFEVMRRDNERGVIACAESADGRDWNYRNMVLSEDFHLSYPQVFEWEGGIYMVPESAGDLSVRLYRAVSFPEKWEHAGNLLSGHAFVDATVFRHGGGWWMFVSTTGNDVLNLYYSDELRRGWQPHPMNPIVRHDAHIARPAGRVIQAGGKLHRFAQDAAPYYGLQVFAFEITELSRETYAEKIVSETPVVTMSGAGWNSAGMHHVDAHPLGDRWIAAVDGKTC